MLHIQGLSDSIGPICTWSSLLSSLSPFITTNIHLSILAGSFLATNHVTHQMRLSTFRSTQFLILTSLTSINLLTHFDVEWSMLEKTRTCVGDYYSCHCYISVMDAAMAVIFLFGKNQLK